MAEDCAKRRRVEEIRYCLAVAAIASASLAAFIAAATPPLPAFTNHAGHAVHGIPVAVTNGLVSLTRDGSNCWTVPLAAFPLPEQNRLRTAAGQPLPQTPATDELRRAEFIRYMQLRREALRNAARIQKRISD